MIARALPQKKVRNDDCVFRSLRKGKINQISRTSFCLTETAFAEYLHLFRKSVISSEGRSELRGTDKVSIFLPPEITLGGLRRWTCRSLEIARLSAGTERGGDVLLETSHHSGDSQFASNAPLRETQAQRMTCL
ncbi:hypothetical protein CDAR_172651 [Caerostris darwini]|uniref:Uncharacterized protein n=1 Tax=Caerostris darwini TaxID=1538125 RepID=A0AAV4MJ29_9ARAC|nr:hypothetical protein CDAR_172651 [Caerostris darwini]